VFLEFSTKKVILDTQFQFKYKIVHIREVCDSVSVIKRLVENIFKTVRINNR